MLFIDIEVMKKAKEKRNISYEGIAKEINKNFDRNLTKHAIYQVFSEKNRRYSTAYMIAEVLGLKGSEVVFLCK